MPLVSRTRATLRSAEFGFFGVFVYTRVQTPRRWGAPFSAGVLVLVVLDWRPLRTNCWIVGTDFLSRRMRSVLHCSGARRLPRPARRRAQPRDKPTGATPPRANPAPGPARPPPPLAPPLATAVQCPGCWAWYC